MTVKLKPVTESAWLVINDTDDNRVGLLTEIRNQYVLMVAGAKKNFINRKEVNNYFKEDIFKNVSVVVTPVVGFDVNERFINGYPVNFDNPITVTIVGNKLPLFTKKQDSNVYYCAGYYCFNFPKEWLGALCPKLSTIQAWEHVGPFKTKDEMKLELSKLRKERKKK